MNEMKIDLISPIHIFENLLAYLFNIIMPTYIHMTAFSIRVIISPNPPGNDLLVSSQFTDRFHNVSRIGMSAGNVVR